MRFSVHLSWDSLVRICLSEALCLTCTIPATPRQVLHNQSKWKLRRCPSHSDLEKTQIVSSEIPKIHYLTKQNERTGQNIPKKCLGDNPRFHYAKKKRRNDSILLITLRSVLSDHHNLHNIIQM